VELSIEHDEAKGIFSCTIDGMTNSAQYERRDNDPVVLDLYRTFVHPEMRGKRIAESLLKHISEYAISQGYTILPSCSYAVLYFRRHREYRQVLAKDVDLKNGGSCRIN
jgi:predicted GNAT family acetyltransferase